MTKTSAAVKVGFVGAVTEHLRELVSPAGIAELDVTDIVTEVNASADDLKADGADVIVLLVHEGAAGTDCADDGRRPDLGLRFDHPGVNDNIDAIVSATPTLPTTALPGAGWAGAPVTERPVVSAGQYGMALNKLVFTVDTATGNVTAKTQALLNLQHCTTNCAGVGTPVWVLTTRPTRTPRRSLRPRSRGRSAGCGGLGKIGGEFHRGKLTTNAENRGAESTWATWSRRSRSGPPVPRRPARPRSRS